MGEGYQVTPADLDAAAQGVREVVEQLTALSHAAGWAQQGRGSVLLAGDSGPIGHAGLGEALAAFSSRWEWGVRAAVRTGHEMAAGLRESAQAYEQGEDTPIRLLQRLVLDLTGDPRGDPGAARPLATGSGETLQDWQHTADSVAATWSATGRDVRDNSTPGMLARALHGENPVAGQLDDVAGLARIGD